MQYNVGQRATEKQINNPSLRQVREISTNRNHVLVLEINKAKHLSSKQCHVKYRGTC